MKRFLFFIISAHMVQNVYATNPYLISPNRSSSRPRVTRQQCCEKFGYVLKQCPVLRSTLCDLQHELLHIEDANAIKNSIIVSKKLCSLESMGHHALDTYIHQQYTGLWSNKDRARLESLLTTLHSLEQTLAQATQDLKPHIKQLASAGNTYPKIQQVSFIFDALNKHLEQTIAFLSKQGA